MAWEDVKQVFRPANVHMGRIAIVAEKCNRCGLCIEQRT